MTWHTLKNRNKIFFLCVYLCISTDARAVCDAEFAAAMRANTILGSSGYQAAIEANQRNWSQGQYIEQFTNSYAQERIATLLRYNQGHEQARRNSRSEREVAEITGKIRLNEHTLCWHAHHSAGQSKASVQNNISNSNGQQNNVPSQDSQQHQLQAAVTQSQTRAREAQQRGDADAQRRGRRVHDPAAEAHECIRPIFTGLYGAFENTCNFPVYYSYCAFRPKSDSWLTSMDCEKQQFGSWEVGPSRQSAAHTKGAESIHWFACKNPAWALDKSFDGGQIQGRCRVVGGN
jgi:hypothetical protein